MNYTPDTFILLIQNLNFQGVLISLVGAFGFLGNSLAIAILILVNSTLFSKIIAQ
jgi:hypothetical protein